MDQSTRLSLVLDGFRAKPSELTTDEYVAILKRALMLASSYASHLSGMKPLRDHSNGYVDNRGFMETDPTVCEFETGIEIDTRCVFLYQLKFGDEEKVLLLDKRGVLILWTARYEYVFDAHNRLKVKKATKSEFRFAGYEDLCALHESFPDRMRPIPNLILKCFTESIDQKEAVISGMQHMRDRLCELVVRTGVCWP